MTAERWERAKEILGRALALPAGERTAFIAAQCGADAPLEAEVASLLRASDEAGAFMPSRTGDGGARGSEGEGDRIGRYKLLQSIGSGGFGEVFMAAQDSPIRRTVALKIIKAGMDTRAVVARFEGERQALALMDHPNIAKILDAGETASGRPYFVMELVKGVAITEYCDTHRLALRDRLALFVTVCRALAHAHERGIIHRDIKPSNILVTLVDGAPAPMVIDFGIAKAIHQPLTARTLFTRFGEFIGTPAYMSPEQAALSNQEVDRRSDVYSLGVLLYELLTGTSPFRRDDLRSAALIEILRIIREEEPPTPSHRVSALGADGGEIAGRRGYAPSTLARFLRGDLDWIVMRALEKDRTRRYDSAVALAADIERHLRSEPVTARRPGPVYRASRFVRRHRMPLSAGLALLVLVGTAGAIITSQRAESRRRGTAQAALDDGLQLQKAGEALAARGDVTAGRGLDEADSAYALAERIDPSFAAAIHQRAALAYRRSRLTARDRPRALAHAETGIAHATRALALEPQSAGGLELRGTLRYWMSLIDDAGDSPQAAQRTARARVDLERAVALDSTQARAWATLSHLYYQTSGIPDVLNAARRAIAADPFVESADLLLNRLILASYDLGDLAQTRQYCLMLGDRFPQSSLSWNCRLLLLTMPGEPPNIPLALQLADLVVAKAPPDSRRYVEVRSALSVAAVIARAAADVPALADSARRMAERARRGESPEMVDDAAVWTAFILTQLGDADGAIRELQAMAARSPERARSTLQDGNWWYRPLQRDPRIQALRAAP